MLAQLFGNEQDFLVVSAAHPNAVCIFPTLNFVLFAHNSRVRGLAAKSAPDQSLARNRAGAGWDRPLGVDGCRLRRGWRVPGAKVRGASGRGLLGRALAPARRLGSGARRRRSRQAVRQCPNRARYAEAGVLHVLGASSWQPCRLLL